MLGESPHDALHGPLPKRRKVRQESILADSTPRPIIMGDDKKAAESVLERQNRLLTGQLEVNKQNLSSIDAELQETKKKQANFDNVLSSVNRTWKELIDDLELLLLRANGSLNGSHIFDATAHIEKDDDMDGVPAERIFLHKLLHAHESDQKPSTSNGSDDDERQHLEAALRSRKATTKKTLGQVIAAIDNERQRNEELAAVLRQKVSSDDVGQVLRTEDERVRKEVKRLRSDMDELHLLHDKLSREMKRLQDCHGRDQAKIKHLTEELERVRSDLDSCRRKLVKEAAASASTPTTPVHANNNHLSRTESKTDRKELDQLVRQKADLESQLQEVERIAQGRLEELQSNHRKQLELQRELQNVKAHLDDEKLAHKPRPIHEMENRVKSYLEELNNAQATINRLLEERDMAIQRERETVIRAEAGETARRAVILADKRIEDLEAKLQATRNEKDSLERRLTEAIHGAGPETVAELRMMLGTFQSEMQMLKGQVERFKLSAEAVPALKAEVHALGVQLRHKEEDCQRLSETVSGQLTELRELREQVKALRTTELELQQFVEMFEQAATDPRDAIEAKKAERRARVQIMELKRELNDHAVEQRVRDARAAQEKGQQKLAAAEAESAQLRKKVENMERELVELREKLAKKDGDGEALESEIETIASAVGEFEAQSMRLEKKLAEQRAENTRIATEGLEAKQRLLAYVSDKEATVTQLQHANTALNLQQQRVSRLEEQLHVTNQQLQKVADDARHYQMQAEGLRRQAQGIDGALQETRGALEQAEKVKSERAIQLEAAEKELADERFKRKRVEEDLERERSKCARLAKHQDRGTDSEALNQEIRTYRSMLKCKICDTRQKSVVITKCYHTFCQQCITSRIENRIRKCPSCQLQFGVNDVHEFFLV
ncbi:E3 ubiquitin ligase involved in syntaxin degradation [Klebsormidium nitens]|uniref:E3 ubiquitin protein ligase n=1 Tax=Klebsormidium nitens TaxID=105231 RepID=A0A1Y1HVZ3_KLENI|nr:E3 ubiquitin ligase involved in syntaxin degradation [Klebsormidium nitens]|eukprot:GAQ80697.1 E3 ubiquitin ligase involved in syntaxin degradation [Klebsormidium nitens]